MLHCGVPTPWRISGLQSCRPSKFYLSWGPRTCTVQSDVTCPQRQRLMPLGRQKGPNIYLLCALCALYSVHFIFSLVPTVLTISSAPNPHLRLASLPSNLMIYTPETDAPLFFIINVPLVSKIAFYPFSYTYYKSFILFRSFYQLRTLQGYVWNVWGLLFVWNLNI